MTGYEVPQDTIRLRFTDDEYAGLEVVLSDTSVEGAFDMIHRKAELIRRRIDPQAATAVSVEELIAETDSLHRLFVDHLLEWNVTQRGEPVPQTFEGLRSLPKRFVGLLVGTWLDTVTGVSPPLPKPSEPGGLPPPEVEAVLAGIPSESLAS